MQTIVMTGATRGIGREALRRMTTNATDLTVVLLARASGDLSWVADEIGDAATVHVVDVDLTSLPSTAAAAARVVELVEAGTIPPLTSLVLNAGVQHTDATRVTTDGLEETFGVNVVANHVLARALAPHSNDGGRLVITVSDTHFGDLRHNLGMVPGPRWRDPRDLARPNTSPDGASTSAGRTAYSTSKLAAIYQVHEYAREYPGLTVVGYNPAFVPGTGLARHAGRASRWAMVHVLPLLARTPIASDVHTSGRDLAALALADQPVATGAYVNQSREERPSNESYDPDRERELVAYLDELCGTQPPR